MTVVAVVEIATPVETGDVLAVSGGKALLIEDTQAESCLTMFCRVEFASSREAISASLPETSDT